MGYALFLLLIMFEKNNVDGGKEANIDGMDIKKQMNSSGTGRTSDRTAELQEKIWQILDEDSEIDGGVTRLTTGDLALRIFGHRAQKLQQIAEKIKEVYAVSE